MQLHGSNQLRAESEMLMFDTVPTLHRAAWFIFLRGKLHTRRCLLNSTHAGHCGHKSEGIRM
jgi:hypothetical protein